MTDKRGPDDLKSVSKLIHEALGEDNTFFCLRAQRAETGDHTRLEYIANMSAIDAVRTLTKVIKELIFDMTPADREQVVIELTPNRESEAERGSKAKAN